METIKNYLDAMFANMPNTPEVRKAKSELLQMMEDKYNELIEEGENENTAVGTVISEFGNLDELADDLGLTKEVEEVHGKEADIPSMHISLEDVKAFISNRTKKAMFLALGIMLCIISVAAPIIFDTFNRSDMGAGVMFIIIALGVGSIVFSSFVDSDWKFMNRELCRIDMSTASYVKERRRSFEAIRAICVTLGIILCIICWVPTILFSRFEDEIGASMIFLLVGIGVFLIVYANKVSSGFDKLLKLNDIKTIAGSYSNEPEKPIKYKSKTAQSVVELYWPTMTCIYLIVSFLTFQWHITWIIWPIAGVAHRAVVINCQADDEE
ncbi:MAG: permease prefix domain 1-containing protein [Lachnospiraceae bacterium]|nr:permease prefix domain 1-containing protein [Lachnospiraceae bacterium]